MCKLRIIMKQFCYACIVISHYIKCSTSLCFYNRNLTNKDWKEVNIIASIGKKYFLKANIFYN